MAKVTDRGLAGPDDPIYKGGLRVSSLPVLNDLQNDTDGTDPMAPAALPLEDVLQKQIVDRNRRVKVPARRPPSTTRK